MNGAADDMLEIVRLARLPPLQYDREREGSAKRLAVRLGTLDKRVAALRPATEATAGRALSFAEVVPWEMPVEGADLLDELSCIFRSHLILSRSASDALALWVLHTWVYDRFEHTPRLTVRSPVKRCGKSTLMEILLPLCQRALKADSISAAAMFRVIQHLSPLTLLIDEADAFLPDNEPLRGIMNSGYSVTGSVIRVEEIQGEQVPQTFRTFAPLAIAAIGKLPATVEDRAVPIMLRRKGAAESITRLRAPGARDRLSNLARKSARWADDIQGSLSRDPAIPDLMGDREGDVCLPLLAIADSAGENWPARARAALLELFNARAGDEGNVEAATLLLTDIRTIFKDSGQAGPDGHLFSSAICGALGRMEERPWPEWRQGKPITPTQLAAVLRPFNIRPSTVRAGADTKKGYGWKAFEDAWVRYSPLAS